MPNQKCRVSFHWFVHTDSLIFLFIKNRSALLANGYYLAHYSSQNLPGYQTPHSRRNSVQRRSVFFDLNIHGGPDLVTALTNQLSSSSVESLHHSISAADSTNGQPEIIGTVFIHHTAKVHSTARIGPNVSISENCVIGAGVYLKHTIILPNVTIHVSFQFMHLNRLKYLC